MIFLPAILRRRPDDTNGDTCDGNGHGNGGCEAGDDEYPCARSILKIATCPPRDFKATTAPPPHRPPPTPPPPRPPPRPPPPPPNLRVLTFCRFGPSPQQLRAGVTSGPACFCGQTSKGQLQKVEVSPREDWINIGFRFGFPSIPSKVPEMMTHDTSHKPWRATKVHKTSSHKWTWNPKRAKQSPLKQLFHINVQVWKARDPTQKHSQCVV